MTCCVPPSRFTEDFLQANDLDPADFRAWALAPGMGLGDRGAWWGAFRPRPTPHEGVDLWGYLPREGPVRRLPEGARVPAPFEGVVVKLLPDYLGTSLFLEHEVEGGSLLAILGHTLPRPGLLPGCRLLAGELLGCMAPRRLSRTAPEAHLHLSLAWAELGAWRDLDWSTLGEPGRVRLLEPLQALGAPWEPWIEN